jgi:hypothetical protein
MSYSIDDPFLRKVVSESSCFLCGSQEDISKEHVFPKWLLNKHDLWNQKLTLLNGTLIPYRSLTIPCCASCNTIYLSKIENQISAAITEGYCACSCLDPLLIFQWMAKIYYGIIRKEVTLQLDRSSEKSPPIFPKEWFDDLHMLHVFMQSIRRPLRFSFESPFSVLVANLHNLGQGKNYNFRDAISHPIASFRSGEVGFIVAFEDAGINQDSYGKYINDVNGRKLHPIQFDELYTKVCYQSSLVNRTLKYVTGIPEDETQPISIVMMPIGGLSASPVLDEWDQEVYAVALAAVLEPWIGPKTIEDESFYKSPNLVSTWMTDSDGNLTFFDEQGNPI